MASTGVAFTVEARTTRTPWIAAASALDENATESTGLFLAGASLIGLAATVRKLSNSRAGLLPKMRIDEMAADER